MGLITWVRDWMSGGITSATPVTEEEYQSLVAELSFRELAFHSCVNMIANSISKCEFKTFNKNKEVKEKEYYLFNVEPNKNQNSSQFLHKLIYQLYANNECLVIAEGDQLLVADSYIVKEYALFDNAFSGVTVGDYSFSKIYSGKDVLFFKLSEQNMRKVINMIYESYGKLLSYTMKHYQTSKGTKGMLNLEALGGGTEDEKNYLKDLINKRFKGYFENDNSVLPLSKGFDYKENPRQPTESTRDIKAMMDDISDFTAKAFGIPPALIRGEIAGISDAMQSYLTFCVDPLVDMIQEEINRKRNGYAAFIAGTYLKIDTRNIKHVDILESATAIDKLIASGVYTINAILDILGEQTIDEDFANTHYLTKNYSTADDLLNALNASSDPPPNTA